MLHLTNEKSVRKHFNEMKILTLLSLYILWSVLCMLKLTFLFLKHKDIQNYNTSNKNNLVIP